jgi:site-specific recombinase XerD
MKSPTNSKDTGAEGHEVLLSEAFEAYREIILYKNQSPKTEESHLVCLRALIGYFGDIEIESLDATMVRGWKLWLDKGRSPATVRTYIIKLRVVLDHLHTEGYAVLDIKRIPVPKRSDTVPSYLTKEDVALLIDSTSCIRSKAIISLLYSSGVRVSELCSLNRDSIYDGTFTIIGKGGRARLCFVDERSCKLIKVYVKTRDDNDNALFISRLSHKRITPGNVQEIFKHLKKKTGIEAHPHTMRHSFCTNLLKSNCNLFYVQRMMGHQSLQTTEAYLHVVDTDLQKIYTEHHTV